VGEKLAKKAFMTALDELYDENLNIIRLFDRPVNGNEDFPEGHLGKYFPGDRENGGQYTHGIVWMVQALSIIARQDAGSKEQRKYGNLLWKIYRVINPAEHAKNKVYRGEPYVTAADISPGGVAGWTGYTGAAGWTFRIMLENMLGLKFRDGNRLFIDPVLPEEWGAKGFKVTKRYGKSVYEIEVINPDGVPSGIKKIELDGARTEPAEGIILINDGNRHNVRVTMGTPEEKEVLAVSETTAISAFHAGRIALWAKHLAEKTLEYSIPMSSIARSLREKGFKITAEETESVIKQLAGTITGITDKEARKLIPALYHTLHRAIIREKGLKKKKKLWTDDEKRSAELVRQKFREHELYKELKVKRQRIDVLTGEEFIKDGKFFELARYRIEKGIGILEIHEILLAALCGERRKKDKLIDALIERELTLQSLQRKNLSFDKANEIFEAYINDKITTAHKKITSENINSMLKGLDKTHQLELLGSAENIIKRKIAKEIKIETVPYTEKSRIKSICRELDKHWPKGLTDQDDDWMQIMLGAYKTFFVFLKYKDRYIGYMAGTHLENITGMSGKNSENYGKFNTLYPPAQVVHPEFRSMGLGQVMRMEVMKRAQALGFEFAETHRKKGAAGKIAKQGMVKEEILGEEMYITGMFDHTRAKLDPVLDFAKYKDMLLKKGFSVEELEHILAEYIDPQRKGENIEKVDGFIKEAKKELEKVKTRIPDDIDCIEIILKDTILEMKARRILKKLKKNSAIKRRYGEKYEKLNFKIKYLLVDGLEEEFITPAVLQYSLDNILIRYNILKEYEIAVSQENLTQNNDLYYLSKIVKDISAKFKHLNSEDKKALIQLYFSLCKYFSRNPVAKFNENEFLNITKKLVKYFEQNTGLSIKSYEDSNLRNLYAAWIKKPHTSFAAIKEEFLSKLKVEDVIESNLSILIDYRKYNRIKDRVVMFLEKEGVRVRGSEIIDLIKERGIGRYDAEEETAYVTGKELEKVYGSRGAGQILPETSDYAKVITNDGRLGHRKVVDTLGIISRNREAARMAAVMSGLSDRGEPGRVMLMSDGDVREFVRNEWVMWFDRTEELEVSLGKLAESARLGEGLDVSELGIG
ncbi:MAG: hypothetical protein ABIH89_01300, partial [Elusimicrobiota bacterium]